MKISDFFSKKPTFLERFKPGCADGFEPMDNWRRLRLVKNGPAPAANGLQIGGLGVCDVFVLL
jgi:hypothetical protein